MKDLSRIFLYSTAKLRLNFIIQILSLQKNNKKPVEHFIRLSNSRCGSKMKYQLLSQGDDAGTIINRETYSI